MGGFGEDLKDGDGAVAGEVDAFEVEVERWWGGWEGEEGGYHGFEGWEGGDYDGRHAWDLEVDLTEFGCV